jgi:hypothetical protein
MQRDLDLEFSRFCEVLSTREKRRAPGIRRKLIRLKRLALKLKRCLEAKSAAAEIVATTR